MRSLSEFEATKDVPRVFHEFWERWELEKQAHLAAYGEGRQSFVPNLLPEQAVNLSVEETLQVLTQRLGPKLEAALDVAGPAQVKSPVADHPDGSWLKTSNMVGINVRTIGSFWNVIPYMLTIPAAQDAVHLLPIWEPGVVGSLYGMSSWRINPEFYSPALAQARPELDSVEKQLQALVRLLHAMGKAVGMDVIPHTDRFSEIVLAQPHYFEWLQREDTRIVDHSAHLHFKVQARIWDFVRTHGPAVPDQPLPDTCQTFFSERVTEEERLRVLFGPPDDGEGRAQRRGLLVKYLHAYGYEPVPATMAPPFRGLEVDVETKYVDAEGHIWRDYRIQEPQSMSRVFGPLARYKLYGRVDDNARWEIDFCPRREVWDYICQKYYQIQRRYGFDFMRGDMSHVQMRPQGVPETLDRYYDILGAVKNYIRQEGGVRYFGYFAESFLPPRDIFGYGKEIDHLEASEADTTLGDLQSTCVGSPLFIRRLRQYDDLRSSRACTPNFTLMTGDKDDPRFDKFYTRGNEARLFIAFFLTDLPSYVALGFETRDVHHTPAPNEHYTKLYVFQERDGPKATHGPYVWGKNGALYHNVTRLRLYLDHMFHHIRGRPTRWLIHPDPVSEDPLIAWTQKGEAPRYLFVVNTDTEHDSRYFAVPAIPHLSPDRVLQLDFSTHRHVPQADQQLLFNAKHYRVSNLAPGEGRVYRL